MLSGEELRQRRSIINEWATFRYINLDGQECEPLPKDYHNRAMRRMTAHTTHRSKWSQWHSRLCKTVYMPPRRKS